MTRKPLQIDLLIIRKSDDVMIQNDIGKIFRKNNIMEFKSPRDGLNINDYYKVLGYACLYKADEGLEECVKSDDVTISLVRDTKPVKLMNILENQGMTIHSYAAGIYYVVNSCFPMQIIVTSELNQEEHLWLRALTEKLSRDSAEKLLHKTSELRGVDEKELANSVITVSVSANKALFSNVKEGDPMFEALECLMENRFQTVREEERQAANLETAKRMLESGRLSCEEIAMYSDLSIEQVEELARELNANLQFV